MGIFQHLRGVDLSGMRMSGHSHLRASEVKINDKQIRKVVVVVFLLFLIILPISIGQVIDRSMMLQVLLRIGSFVLLLEGNRRIVLESLYRYSFTFIKLKRFLYFLPLGILFNSLLMLLTLALDNYISTGTFAPTVSTGFQIYFNHQPVQMNIVSSAVIKSTFIFTFFWYVYETVYNYFVYQKTKQQQNAMDKERLQSQLDSLKQQINPHFLFNSLNSLSSLIATNPDKAEEFVEEMSRVYRYLLQSNDSELTSLSKELAFINSYILLLQTRFGEGIQTHIDIDEQLLNRQIPPMTLQLLVENAVKHNITDRDKPLTLEIYNKGEKLVISNNIQAKTKLMPSTGIGLKNIREKYRLLNQPEVEIIQTDTLFTVIIPLI
ncbi:histidine kinase [Catalinimonas sp. 4WD22]|uniref:sensor histidine kinase n=1 Tax=Catalinimonas locisalis TaxID=3133978 RepID=UPI003101AD8E